MTPKTPSNTPRLLNTLQLNDNELTDRTSPSVSGSDSTFPRQKATAVAGTTLLLVIPRETALKIIRLHRDFLVDGSKTPWQIASVPSQRHPDKTTLAVYLPRTLMQRLRRLAAVRGETVTTVVEALVTAQTRDVVLTPEDYEQIARETRAAQGRRPRRAAK